MDMFSFDSFQRIRLSLDKLVPSNYIVNDRYDSPSDLTQHKVPGHFELASSW